MEVNQLRSTYVVDLSFFFMYSESQNCRLQHPGSLYAFSRTCADCLVQTRNNRMTSTNEVWKSCLKAEGGAVDMLRPSLAPKYFTITHLSHRLYYIFITDVVGRDRHHDIWYGDNSARQSSSPFPRCRSISSHTKAMRQVLEYL